MSGVGWSHTLVTYETSQVLLAGVPGVFFTGFSRFRPPTDWPVSDAEVILKKENKSLTEKRYEPCSTKCCRPRETKYSRIRHEKTQWIHVQRLGTCRKKRKRNRCRFSFSYDFIMIGFGIKKHIYNNDISFSVLQDVR